MQNYDLELNKKTKVNQIVQFRSPDGHRADGSRVVCADDMTKINIFGRQTKKAENARQAVAFRMIPRSRTAKEMYKATQQTKERKMKPQRQGLGLLFALSSL